MKKACAFLLLPLAALAQDDLWDDDDWDEAEAASRWSGFIEGGLGTRVDDDERLDARNTLEEVRWRLEAEWHPPATTLSFKGDAGYDRLDDGWFADLRELSVAFSPGGSTDVTVGRQILTWGTGDLVFLNDLFPKDFVSFFAGRDDQYLKAPSDAVRIAHYTPLVNIDFVWTPLFEPDEYLTGERFSFFSPLAGGIVAPSPPFGAERPDESFANGEFAVRLYRTIESTEYALYGYRGFFKQPRALTPSLAPGFAPLSAFGASLRRPAGPGLVNVEASYYDSRDDRDGADPLLPNDQFRLLAGYEWEAKPRFTVAFQYYLEWTLDHDELTASSPFPQWEPDEYRHLLTNRLTYRTNLDRYTWSLFTFFSASDEDFYLRPSFTYRASDRFTFVAGGNLFGGDADHTFFGQLEDGGNAYLRLTFNY